MLSSTSVCAMCVVMTFLEEALFFSGLKTLTKSCWPSSAAQKLSGKLLTKGSDLQGSSAVGTAHNQCPKGGQSTLRLTAIPGAVR